MTTHVSHPKFGILNDLAVDPIVRKKDGSNALVQIKARSAGIAAEHAALFAAIPHKHHQDEDYWFIFYSEHMDKIWLLNSEEFIEESTPNINGGNAGLRSIKFNGCRADIETGNKKPYVKDRYLQYVIGDFSRLKNKTAVVRRGMKFINFNCKVEFDELVNHETKIAWQSTHPER